MSLGNVNLTGHHCYYVICNVNIAVTVLCSLDVQGFLLEQQCVEHFCQWCQLRYVIGFLSVAIQEYVFFIRIFLNVAFLHQAIVRQWKQWCTDHKGDKTPNDVVSLLLYSSQLLNYFKSYLAYVRDKIHASVVSDVLTILLE